MWQEEYDSEEEEDEERMTKKKKKRGAVSDYFLEEAEVDDDEGEDDEDEDVSGIPYSFVWILRLILLIYYFCTLFYEDMNKSSGVECTGWFLGFGLTKYGIQVVIFIIYCIA